MQQDITFDLPPKVAFSLSNTHNLDTHQKKMQAVIVNKILFAKQQKRERKIEIEDKFSVALTIIEDWDNERKKLTAEKILYPSERCSKYVELIKKLKFNDLGIDINQNEKILRDKNDCLTSLRNSNDNNKMNGFLIKYLGNIKTFIELEYIKERIGNDKFYFDEINKILTSSEEFKNIINIYYGEKRFNCESGNLYKKKRLPGDAPQGAVEGVTKDPKGIEEYNYYVCDKYNNYIKRYQFRAISSIERMILSENPDESAYIEPADYGKEFNELEGIREKQKLKLEETMKKNTNTIRTININKDLDNNQISQLLKEELGEFSLNRIGHQRLIAASPAYNKYVIRSNDLTSFIDDGSIFDTTRHFYCIDSDTRKLYVSQGGGVIKIDLLHISKKNIRSQYTKTSFENMDNKLPTIVSSISMDTGYDSRIADELFLAKKSAYRNREVHLIELPINSIIGWKPYVQFPWWLEKNYISSPLIRPQQDKFDKHEFYRYNISIINNISNIIQNRKPCINSSKLRAYVLEKGEYSNSNYLLLIGELNELMLKHKNFFTPAISRIVKKGLYLSLNNIIKYINNDNFNKLSELLKKSIDEVIDLSQDDFKNSLHPSLDGKNENNNKSSSGISNKSNNTVSTKDKVSLINSDNSKLSPLEFWIHHWNKAIASWLLEIHFSLSNSGKIASFLTSNVLITNLLAPESTVSLYSVPEKSSEIDLIVSASTANSNEDTEVEVGKNPEETVKVGSLYMMHGMLGKTENKKHTIGQRGKVQNNYLKIQSSTENKNIEKEHLSKALANKIFNKDNSEEIEILLSEENGLMIKFHIEADDKNILIKYISMLNKSLFKNNILKIEHSEVIDFLKSLHISAKPLYTEEGLDFDRLCRNENCCMM